MAKQTDKLCNIIDSLKKPLIKFKLNKSFKNKL